MASRAPDRERVFDGILRQAAEEHLFDVEAEAAEVGVSAASGKQLRLCSGQIVDFQEHGVDGWLCRVKFSLYLRSGPDLCAFRSRTNRSKATL